MTRLVEAVKRYFRNNPLGRAWYTTQLPPEEHVPMYAPRFKNPPEFVDIRPIIEANSTKIEPGFLEGLCDTCVGEHERGTGYFEGEVKKSDAKNVEPGYCWRCGSTLEEF